MTKAKQAVLFAARAELEGDRENLLYGPPATEQALTDRVIAALAEQANATASTANDRPVLVDLNQAPAEPAEAGTSAGTSATAGAGVPAANRHEGLVPGDGIAIPASVTASDAAPGASGTVAPGEPR